MRQFRLRVDWHKPGETQVEIGSISEDALIGRLKDLMDGAFSAACVSDEAALTITLERLKR